MLSIQQNAENGCNQLKKDTALHVMWGLSEALTAGMIATSFIISGGKYDTAQE
jgi:hypothetical protein